MIFIAADHRGFQLKQRLFKRLIDEGFLVTDLGNNHADLNDDYVDFAKRVAEATVADPINKGILLCGSGVGVDIVANKIDGVRCALVDNPQMAKQSREHEDANVLALPADLLDEERALEIIKVFLNTSFSAEERHLRRLGKLAEVEKHE